MKVSFYLLCSSLTLASCVARSKNEEPQADASTAAVASAPNVLGVYSDLRDFSDKSTVKNLVTSAKKMGLNHIYQVVWKQGCTLVKSKVMAEKIGQEQCAFGRRYDGWFADLISEGKAQGITVIPWFEWGFKVPLESKFYAYAKEHKLLAADLGDPGAEMKSAYLDIFKDEARYIIFNMQKELVQNYDVVAVQWDDNLSIAKKSTGNLTPQRVAEYESQLGVFAKGLQITAKQAKPNLRMELCHNKLSWATSAYHAHWDQWGFDRVFVETYVSNNLLDDQRADSARAAGFDVLIATGSDYATPAELKKAFGDIDNSMAGKGIILFHFQAIPPSAYADIAAAIVKHGK